MDGMLRREERRPCLTDSGFFISGTDFEVDNLDIKARNPTSG